ncbi:MAG: hypothetical protein HOP09_15460 [Hyphomicrobium sp.]|nr:hypothetical protein [Hyphomicrobium sp.]
MIRIVIENIFVFLVPTLVYVAWIAFMRNDWPGLYPVLRAAPLLNLFVLGAALMFGSMVAVSSRTRNAPGDAYVPPAIQDGKLQPGHAVPVSK